MPTPDRKKIRVAILTNFPSDPGRPRGGVQAVSVNLVRALARMNDLDVHVATTDPNCSDVKTDQWEGASVTRLPWEGRKVLQHVLGPGKRRVQDYLRTLKPDVIHAHDIYGLMVKRLETPRVFTIHGFIHEDTRVARERFARLRAAIWKRIEIAGWAAQPHIISISPYVRERLAGLVHGRIHDIENPVSEDLFELERDECQGRIFCAALICPRKNTLGLIAAFHRLVRTGTEAELRLAGSVSDPAYGRRVERMITERGLRGRVHLLGKLSMAQVREELARASVVALVSYEEGAPLSISEAMAMGVPVVTSNRCGMPYMVRDGESGFLVDPDDPVEVASRLSQLLNSRELRNRMGRNARKQARHLYHPASVAERTRQVYLQALGRTCEPVCDQPMEARVRPSSAKHPIS